jgi:hypothetical protein
MFLTAIDNLRAFEFDTYPLGFLICFPRGAVAQLAERRVRNAEARSSTLLCSTIYFKHLQPPALAAVFVNWPIRGHFSGIQLLSVDPFH